MPKRVTSVATPVAHLIGPGKIKVINGQLAYVARETPPLRLEPRELDTLMCYGHVGVTDEAMTVLFQNNVETAFLTPGGNRCRGRLVRCDPPTTSLRMLQHRALADGAFALEWARSVVQAKVQSQIQAVRHYQRHGYAEGGPVRDALAVAAASARSAPSLEELRGIEGAASSAWFQVFAAQLIAPWQFPRRVRRPPTDPVNGLLSLGYTWLIARVQARAEASGLEIYLGGLHDYRPGRPSLACDLMEPLRVPAVDRWVLALCNGSRVKPEDFVADESGGIRLKPETFPDTLQSWQTHWIQSGLQGELEQVVRRFIRLLRGSNPEPGGAAESTDPDAL